MSSDSCLPVSWTRVVTDTSPWRRIPKGGEEGFKVKGDPHFDEAVSEEKKDEEGETLEVEG